MPKRAKTYPGHLQLREGKSGDTYRWIFKHDGKEYSETITNARGLSARLFRAEAEKFARTRGEQIQENATRIRLGLPGEMRVSELIDEYEREELPLRAPGTVQSYKMRLPEIRAYFEHLGDPMVQHVRRIHVRGYANWRRSRSRAKSGVRAERVADSTLRSETAIISAVFSFAVEVLELVEVNPARSRKRRGKAAPGLASPAYLLSPGEYEKLLRELEGDPQAWTYTLLLGEAGPRDRSEALRLKWPDLRFDSGTIRIVSGAGRETKSGRSRTVPMTDRLAAALRAHADRYRLATYPDPDPMASPALAAELARLSARDRKAVAALLAPVYNNGINAKVLQDRARDRLRGVDVEERRRLWTLALSVWRSAVGESGALPGRRSPWVFCHQTAARHARPGDPFTKAMPETIMAAARRAGIPTGQGGGFVPHALRHRCASLWVLQGNPLAVVGEWLGHRQISTVMLYTHVAEDNRARLLGEVDGSEHLLRMAG